MSNHNHKEFLQDDGQLRVFIVPVDIMDVPDLTIYEQMTYIVLRSYVNPTDPTAFPSYPTIAKRGRMSRSSAIRAVEGLVQKGLITKEIRLDVSKNRKIKNASNMYTLITPKKRKPEGSAGKGSVSQKRGVVSHRNGGSVSQTPYHNHLKEPFINMNECMKGQKEISATSETATNEFHKELYETLSQEVPKHCFMKGLPLTDSQVTSIFLMLLKQFSNRLNPNAVSLAARLYFDRACYYDIKATNGVSMKIDIDNPEGFFYTCYKDALKLQAVKK